MLKRPLIRLAVLGLMLLGSAMAFYLISPLFVRASFGFDGWPTLGYMPTRTPRPATETPAPTETAQPTATDADIATLLEGDSALVLAQGGFYAVAHEGSGTANLYQTEQGPVLRLEEFEVEDGPDLHVYLTAQDPVENTSGVELADGLDLGELKGLSGDQSYELPEGIDLTDYKSVVIWCVPFQVPFLAAPLDVAP